MSFSFLIAVLNGYTRILSETTDINRLG